MLITRLKAEEELVSLIKKEKPYIFKCFGCREVFFPEEEIDALIDLVSDSIQGVARIDYLCNQDFAKNYLEAFKEQVGNARSVLVFSCGVGVQVLSSLMTGKRVYPGCDTDYINGFQGVDAQGADCEQCGSCYLNLTGGLCPLTSCSKGLLNGPCGGTKEGKCEVDSQMDCGWYLIHKRLADTGREDLLRETPVAVRNYLLIIREEEQKS